jgi:hypothetical protein
MRANLNKPGRVQMAMCDKDFRGLYIGLNFFVTFFVHPKKVKKKD